MHTGHQLYHTSVMLADVGEWCQKWDVGGWLLVDVTGLINMCACHVCCCQQQTWHANTYWSGMWWMCFVRSLYL